MAIFTGATTVANKYHLARKYPGWTQDEHFVYIGRKREGMHFGNPFSSRPMTLAEIKVDSREASIEAFRLWISNEAYPQVEPERRQWILENVWRLRGKTLVCFCSPQPCHGDCYCQMLD